MPVRRRAVRGVELEGRWGAAREGEGEQQAAARRERARPARLQVTRCPRADPPPAGGDPLRQADDRLAAGVATEQQRDQQHQQRDGGEQEGEELTHGSPG